MRSQTILGRAGVSRPAPAPLPDARRRSSARASPGAAVQHLRARGAPGYARAVAQCGAPLHFGGRSRRIARAPGAIAQLGERLDRTQEVGGSSPPSSIESACKSAVFLLIAAPPRIVADAAIGQLFVNLARWAPSVVRLSEKEARRWDLRAAGDACVSSAGSTCCRTASTRSAARRAGRLWSRTVGSDLDAARPHARR